MNPPEPPHFLLCLPIPVRCPLFTRIFFTFLLPQIGNAWSLFTILLSFMPFSRTRTPFTFLLLSLYNLKWLLTDFISFNSVFIGNKKGETRQWAQPSKLTGQIYSARYNINKWWNISHVDSFIHIYMLIKLWICYSVWWLFLFTIKYFNFSLKWIIGFRESNPNMERTEPVIMEIENWSCGVGIEGDFKIVWRAICSGERPKKNNNARPNCVQTEIWIQITRIYKIILELQSHV